MGIDHQCQNAFALLDRAIGLRRPVVFTYTSANGATQRREVEPRELHLEGTGWMLLGWCMIDPPDGFLFVLFFHEIVDYEIYEL